MENTPIGETTPTETKEAVVGSKQLQELTEILNKYNSGLTKTKERIKEAENWWKLRNTIDEVKQEDGGFKSVSGWLHNVIVSKHADAIEAYPEPNILPREEGDRAEATKLSRIVPCIMEHNNFEKTYSDVMWQKSKFGTGVYKIIWDKTKLNGLGDIGIEKVNILNVFWEPGKDNIQKSKYFFHTELCDIDIIEQQYPELIGKLKGNQTLTTKFLYDDTIDTNGKVTVVDVYYHKTINGILTVQYVKYVNDNVLYATENDANYSKTGLYNHAKYPYVFDPLFPIEGSPCGYGYVDICKNPQLEIDLMKTSFVRNTMVGSTPRYFSKIDGGVNEDEFLNLSKPIVHVSGNLSDDYLRQINFNPLDGIYVNVLDRTIQELRETSGNTETSTGNISSGVTAASAIAALQEASGKGSRDANMASYRAYSEIVGIVIELIRQFYDMPRQFRIIGDYGAEQYISYTNQNLKPQHQGLDFGQDMGYRLPVFDIKISAQKKNTYNKITQNELAIQFFNLGFFNPQMVDQALMTLQMMEFDGKDELLRKIAENGTMFDKLVYYIQLAIQLAQVAQPEIVESLAQDYMMTTGGAMPQGSIGQVNYGGEQIAETTRMQNARAQARNASQA